MIDFERFTLANGLKVIVHRDTSTPMACVNILYDVGARDEDSERTGFAHLFEHLMFGGSVNIPDYDNVLQQAGGENNAFTSNDITNYYLTLPAVNLEVAFWLESDRMLSLAFSEKSLEVQRNVVIEEFKQSYLNQPYGDIWLEIPKLAYKVHPYLWPTIGKNIDHIKYAVMEDVKAFFKRFYCPNNAILCVTGNITVEEVKRLCEKWFAPIPMGNPPKRNLPVEPPQTESRMLVLERDVPASAIYKLYHMGKRADKSFYIMELLADILTDGNASRLYVELVKNQKLFSEINAFTYESLDPGIFIVTGKLLDGVTLEQADAAIQKELEKIVRAEVQKDELEKAKNKTEAQHIFAEISILNKAMNLSFFELLGDAQNANKEVEKFFAVSEKDILDESISVLKESNCSTLYYRSKSKSNAN
ncbi:MAG TPA: pitrilysin family protein [Bacteroidia bacterium]|jgi:zinc protease|nr:pitrilysin family protein [Bacteroidia bacterium]